MRHSEDMKTLVVKLGSPSKQGLQHAGACCAYSAPLDCLDLWWRYFDLSLLSMVACICAGRKKLRRLRAKLVRRILWSPLFDVGAWVNDMDLALRLVWEAHVARRTTTDSGTNHNHMGQHFDADVDNVVAVRPRAIF